MAIPEMRTSPWIKVRNSKIHGKGVFAAKRIPKGTRVIEYLGDRISHAEADARYEDHDPNDNHTFLFIVDKKTVIDAGVKGNAARFINHSCDGNCESVIEQSRVFIETTRVVEAGQELGYDYEIGREKDDHRTSMKSLPVAAARPSAAAPCCGRRSGLRRRSRRPRKRRPGAASLRRLGRLRLL